jgi:putative ABC transport system permease protein
MSSMDDDRIPNWRRYLRFWRRDHAADVHDELSFHIESAADEFIAMGMTRTAAREAARQKFGDVARISNTLNTLTDQRERTMQRTELLDTIRKDIAFALRQLRKSPGFTLVAVLTLALGIGANSAIFSVVYSVLLKPLPFANAERVLNLNQASGQNQMCCLPFGNFDTWRKEANGFEAIGAIWGTGPLVLTGHGDPTPIPAPSASAGYWQVMFVPPVAGRYFTEEEDRDGGPKVVVLSYALWQNKFSGDRSIIGRSITLDGQPYMVVGVAPPAYILNPPAERLWRPLAPPPSRLNDFGDHELTVYGLLKPNTPADVAVRQLVQIDTRLAHEHPHNGYDGSVIATPLIDNIVGPHRTTLFTLLGAVGLVLLIACGNVANLLLARANVRRPEIAIRGALGASRGRIVSQLLVESALLGLTGGVLGLGLAAAGMRFLVSGPARIPRLGDVSLNLPVLAFTSGLALLCSLIFGLVPALRASRTDLQQTLRDGGRESRSGDRERLRNVLVITELCVAQVLLIGAGLLIRSAILVQSVPAGFDTHNLVGFGLQLPDARYASDARVEAAFQQLESAIAAVPGVKSVGRTQVAPIYGGGWNWTAFREGSDGHDAGAVTTDMRSASVDYFKTLDLRLIRGRTFTIADGQNAPPVAIVSRGLAKRLWGNEDPIGKRIANGSQQKPGWKEVVGVVDDMHADGPNQEAPLEQYWPSAQYVNGAETFLVRGSVPVTTLMPAIRKAVASVDPLLAFSGVRTIDESIDNRLAMSRFTTWLLTLLGATGLILAAVGVYGVIAYVVTQRTHEFGVRMALGATSGGVRWLVVRQGFVVALIGVLIGSGLSFAASRLLRGMVFGITEHDPMTFVVVGTVLTIVAVAASYIPARRATRIDPLTALRRS